MRNKKPDTPTRHPLVARIQKLFSKDLAAENDFLRAENRVLRELHGERLPRLNHEQRAALVKHGVPLGERLGDVISIVKPETLLKWHRMMKRKKWDFSRRKSEDARRKPESTERIVLRLAGENPGWGIERISDELRKVGHSAAPNTVAAILRRNGFPDAPGRKGLSWKEFIQSHMDVAWAADFFTDEVWTPVGLMTVYVLFFIHLRTRRVFFAGCTEHPATPWMAQHARNFSMHADETGLPCEKIIHDRDTTFLPLDKVLKAHGIEPVKVSAPQCNCFAERFVREARETLDNLILVGDGQLFRAMRNIEKHHNEQRPHQGLGGDIPCSYDWTDKESPPEDVRCVSTLGGLLKHYHVAKAA